MGKANEPPAPKDRTAGSLAVFGVAAALAIVVAASGLDGWLAALGELLLVVFLLFVHRSALGGEARRRVDLERAAAETLARATVMTGALARALPDGLLRIARGALVVEVTAPGDAALATILERCQGRRLDSLFPDALETPFADLVGGILASDAGAPISVEFRAERENRRLEVRFVRSSDEECLAVFRDVTESRQLSEKLLVNDRLASLGTLATGVAHEINNPLAYVTANIDYALQTLEREPAGPLAPLDATELVEALREARSGSHRIAAIVTSLKKQARQDEEPVTAVDCRAAVETAIRMLESRLRHHARLEVDIGEVPPVLANSQRLVQVVMNLLANSIDALPERGTDANLIRVSVRVAENRRVLVEVTDNGTGIPVEVLDKIFDPFFTTKAPGAGTGLGLYLSHQFVTSFGGTLDVRSVPGDHTTFRMELQPAERVPSSHPASGDVRVPRSRILVVDDEVLVGRALARCLPGHQVVTAADGAAALAMCLSEPPDVIVCDVMMPNMNGASFHAKLSAARPDLARRVVFMTGGAFTQDCRDFLASVQNPRIDKPVDARALLRVMEELLAAPRSPHEIAAVR